MICGFEHIFFSPSLSSWHDMFWLNGFMNLKWALFIYKIALIEVTRPWSLFSKTLFCGYGSATQFFLKWFAKSRLWTSVLALLIIMIHHLQSFIFHFKSYSRCVKNTNLQSGCEKWILHPHQINQMGWSISPPAKNWLMMRWDAFWILEFSTLDILNA